MKKLIFLCILLALFQNLLAEEKKSHTISIQSVQADYIPYTYEFAKSLSNLDPNNSMGPLKNTDVNFIKLNYQYTNPEKTWGILTSWYRFNQTKTWFQYSYIINNYNLQPGDSRIYSNRSSNGQIERSDFKFNGYKYFKTENHLLGLGGGLRNINIAHSSPFASQYYYYGDTMRTWGPELSLLTKSKISKSFSFDFKADFFGTIGKRIYESGGGEWKEMGSSKTKGTFLGYELDAGISWLLNENFSFSLGYNYTKAKFEYYNYETTSNYFMNSYYLNPKVYNKPQNDVLHGWYFGVNATF